MDTHEIMLILNNTVSFVVILSKKKNQKSQLNISGSLQKSTLHVKYEHVYMHQEICYSYICLSSPDPGSKLPAKQLYKAFLLPLAYISHFENTCAKGTIFFSILFLLLKFFEEYVILVHSYWGSMKYFSRVVFFSAYPATGSPE